MLQGRSQSGRDQGPQAQPQANQPWTWESFCREEAREAASTFLERVRRFKARHSAARDVHDSTFTNEFSAAFLEESSILMAREGDPTTTSTVTNGATFTTSLPASIHSRVVGNGQGRELEGNRRQANNVRSTSGKSSWWSGLFKWSSKSKRSRERQSSENSSSSNSPVISSRGSTRQKKRGIKIVKETATVQLLNLSDEDGEGMNWSSCRLMLVEQQENYQIEIYCPPRNPMPKMSLFCFLIDEVRSASSLEIPDSNSCFVIKSQNHGEYVFDVRAEELKEEWVRLLQAYTQKTPATAASNGHLPRSSVPSSHLATLPRAPSSSPPHRSHGGGGGGGGGGVPLPTLDSSPLLVSRTRDLPPRAVAGSLSGSSEPASRHMSLSVPRKNSVLSSSLAPGDSEESVLVDMNSFMRNYSNTRSPNRQRKTMSMFVDPSTHIPAAQSTPNPYVQAHGVSVLASPPSSHVSVAESPTRFPYVSPQGSPPPPLPRRDRSYSMYIKNARGISSPVLEVPPNNDVVTTSAPSGATRVGLLNEAAASQVVAHAVGGKPLPKPPPTGARPLPATPTSPTPTGSRPLPATTTSPTPRPLPATPTSPMPRPLPITPTSPTPASPGFRPLPPTPTETTTQLTSPTSSRFLPATPTETTPHPTGPTQNTLPELPPAIPSRINGRTQHKHSKRKMSQPILELPTSSQQIGGMHDLPTPGNLESCSQSSSSSALHPVSIAALSKTRKNSIPFSPADEGDGSFQLLGVQSGGTREGGNGVWRAGKDRARKTSAPVFAPDVGAARKAVANGSTPSPGGVAVGRRSFHNSPSDGASAHLADGEKDESQDGAGEEDTAERDKCTSPVSPDKSESCSSPITFDPSRGFCEGEEQTDHATMSFPSFTQRSTSHQQRSSSPLFQGSPASELVSEENQSPPGSGSQHPGNGQIPSISSNGQAEGIPTTNGAHYLGLQPPNTPPLPINDRVLATPPITADSTHPLSLSREGATSQASNVTNASTHSISSLEDRDSSIRADSVSSNNPIFVETSEGREYNHPQATVHTRHPYEFWATNQQDITNLRSLSQFPWFHGMISRNNASQLVLANGDRGTGQYLVRQSESREGDFVLTFNYHNRAKHLRMAVDGSGCNIQHLWFDSVPCMLEYFKTNSIPLESFWLNDDVKLTNYIDRQASDGFRTTTVINVDQLNRVPPRRSRSLHLGMSRSTAGGGSSHPGTPGLATMEHRSGSASASTNSLPFTQSNASGWRQIFRSQRSSSAGNVGRVQRSHSHNAGSIQNTGRGGGGGNLTQRVGNRENSYVWRNY